MIRIGRPTRRCSVCGTPLPDKNGAWFSGLYQEGDSYRRHEFCSDCIIRYRDGLFCWWKRKRRPRRVIFDKEGALLFFEELTRRGTADERLVCAMALVLLRRGVVRLLEIRNIADRRVMILRSKKEQFVVPSLPLEDAVLQELRQSLDRLFEG